MVARDAATGTKSAPINPLKTETPEERFLFSLGEKNIALRAKMDQDTLLKEPPSQEESSLIHKMFLNTVDHSARSWSARMIPKNGKWMGDAKLKSIILCEPQHRNAYNKVFGGLIMEKCVGNRMRNISDASHAELMYIFYFSLIRNSAFWV